MRQVRLTLIWAGRLVTGHATNACRYGPDRNRSQLHNGQPRIWEYFAIKNVRKYKQVKLDKFFRRRTRTRLVQSYLDEYIAVWTTGANDVPLRLWA